MLVPIDVARAVERELADGIAHSDRVAGGCISPAARIEMQGGSAFFLKWGSGEPADLFAAEAAGLAALRATGTVRVPDTIAHRRTWLLLEWLEAGPGTPSAWQDLGRSLAALHAVRGPAFGGDADNYIGSLPQSNARNRNWRAFWVDARLAPMIARTAASFAPSDRARLERFCEGLDALLAVGDDDGASLLHGDLWGGNVHVCADGRAALIDPSCYHGHREVDLAMATLFGGFERDFFDAYEAEWPLLPGWRERRAAYQLYYLLVHVALFGESYVGRTLDALRAAGG